MNSMHVGLPPPPPRPIAPANRRRPAGAPRFGRGLRSARSSSSLSVWRLPGGFSNQASTSRALPVRTIAPLSFPLYLSRSSSVFGVEVDDSARRAGRRCRATTPSERRSGGCTAARRPGPRTASGSSRGRTAPRPPGGRSPCPSRPSCRGSTRSPASGRASRSAAGRSRRSGAQRLHHLRVVHPLLANLGDRRIGRLLLRLLLRTGLGGPGAGSWARIVAMAGMNPATIRANGNRRVMGCGSPGV